MAAVCGSSLRGHLAPQLPLHHQPGRPGGRGLSAQQLHRGRPQLRVTTQRLQPRPVQRRQRPPVVRRQHAEAAPQPAEVLAPPRPRLLAARHHAAEDALLGQVAVVDWLGARALHGLAEAVDGAGQRGHLRRDEAGQQRPARGGRGCQPAPALARHVRQHVLGPARGLGGGGAVAGGQLEAGPGHLRQRAQLGQLQRVAAQRGVGGLHHPRLVVRGRHLPQPGDTVMLIPQPSTHRCSHHFTLSNKKF